jgi:hypothetical protein
MTQQAISPLRQRMIEDMAIRKFAPKTQHDYVQRVKDFAVFLGRSPDTAISEDVRGFRLHLASSGAGAPKINATVSALRFFFNVTLDRPDLAKHLAFMHEPRKVPVVLSPEALGGHVARCGLRLYHDRLQLLPQPALPEVPGRRGQGMARRPRGRAVAGAVLSAESREIGIRAGIANPAP